MAQQVASRWLQGARLPTLEELAPFCAGEECYLHAEDLVRKLRKYKLKYEAGAYIKDGRYLDHAWTSTPDGTIIDTTHSQFDRGVPVLIARPGTREHARYLRAEDMTEDQLRLTYGDP